jgi:AcrR family transcriptional regulator
MDHERKPRVDAERNRGVVLLAAARLFDAADDPERVSMSDIAAAAGVGKGTLFRGFGDRLGLILALVEQRNASLYADFTARMAAEQATPAERVLSALEALLTFKTENRALMLALENGGNGSPYAAVMYDQWHAQLTGIVTEARGPHDAPFLAHALLAAVRSDLIEYLRDEPGRVRSGLAALTRAIVA